MLGGDGAGTAGPNWPNGCLVAYDVMLSNKMCVFGWGVWEEGERFFQDSCCWGITLAGHESTGGERLLFFLSFSSLLELPGSWSFMYFLPFQFSPLFCLGVKWFTCQVWSIYCKPCDFRMSLVRTLTFSAQWSASPYQSFIFLSCNCIIISSITD